VDLLNCCSLQFAGPIRLIGTFERRVIKLRCLRVTGPILCLASVGCSAPTVAGGSGFGVPKAHRISHRATRRLSPHSVRSTQLCTCSVFPRYFNPLLRHFFFRSAFNASVSVTSVKLPHGLRNDFFFFCVGQACLEGSGRVTVDYELERKLP
jgi:hypothetical protein